MLTFPQALALIPAPAKRPPLKIPCGQCRGTGRLLASGDPRGDDWTDRPCTCDEGEVPADCQICGDDPAVEVIVSKHDGKKYRACEDCVEYERTHLTTKEAS